MKKLLLFCIFLISIVSVKAQTLDELKSEKSVKQDSIDAIQKRVDDLQKLIDNYPGWKFGAFGTIGGSFSGFNNWYSQNAPNNSAGAIGISVNPFAKYDGEKVFWYNQAQLNLGWVKFDDKDDPTDDDSFREATDVFNIVSLFGYNLSEKFALDFLGEYRTTVLSNFNDPGYLDLGVGVTWKPITDLVVVINPFNYNIVFSDEDLIFESSLGTKIFATYNKKIDDLAIKSSLSMFQSYKSSDLSNWTWVNSLSYKLWKDFGVGFEFGLRDNKQEALNYAINTLGDTTATFDNVDNDLQSYWIFGLTYSF
ncbi:MAG TPA: DUF3078 domain-containing protein [Flavobacteriaceae bacterium]|nr:DUF3078 domain-containing protein [Flavobacteriaceae bacterium]